MSNNIILSAVDRKEVGKAEVRRLRRLANMVPAVIYGGEKAPINIKLKENEVLKAFATEGIYSQVLDLTVNGEATAVIVKDMLPHPTKPKVMHIDFVRVDRNKPITVAVPLHFTGEEECVGAKAGGIISRTMTEIELVCLPKYLPASLELDISALDIEQSLHQSDITLPANVEFAQAIDDEHNPGVVVIHKAQVESEPEEGEAAESESADGESGDKAAGDSSEGDS